MTDTPFYRCVNQALSAECARIERYTAKLEAKMPLASDWEKVELTERISGLWFAKACLDEAWDKQEV